MKNGGANFADSSYHLLHVDTQNACVLTYKAPEKVIFEISEVSPSNEAANLTKGRLVRSFPDVAVAIPLPTFQEEGFVSTVAHTLTKMSDRETNIFPQRGGSTLDGDQYSQNTTSCTLVTDVLGAFMLSQGGPASVGEIIKHTRNEVISSGKSRSAPWRRAPIWDLLKICLQTIVCRESETGLQSYKAFMVFFMARLLGKAIDAHLKSDILEAMKAKIAKRLAKMGKTFSAPFLHKVRQTMQKAEEKIQQRFEKVQLQCKQRDAIPSLCNLRWDGAGKFVFKDLEEFLSVYNPSRSSRNYSEELPELPKSGIWQLHDSVLPDLATVEGDESLIVSSLCAFERWIASNLDSWLVNNLARASTAPKLSELAEVYFKRAQPAYKGYPEGISKMYLTFLEIVVACDKVVCRKYLLLTRYPIPIPVDICSNLLIGSGTNLERLNKIESYLHARSLKKELDGCDILHDFGGEKSFAVRFYRQNYTMQKRLRRIRKDANVLEDSKMKEFHNIQEKRDIIIQKSRKLSHEEQPSFNGQLLHDETRCRHCCLKKQADTSFSIKPWHRPIPEARAESQAIAFELNVPPGFGEWRDVMAFAVDEVFGLRAQAPEQAHRPRLLEEFDGLNGYFHGKRDNARVTLACESFHIPSTSEDITVTERIRKSDVCLCHGIRWGIFDKKKKTFTSTLTSTEKVAKLCTFKLPSRSQDHQDLLLRPQSAPDGVGPNEVVARQAMCPAHFTPSEYQALLTSPLGHRIQWRNILLELASDKIDLQKTETALVLSQIALQAGPAPASVTQQDTTTPPSVDVDADVLFSDHLDNSDDSSDSDESDPSGSEREPELDATDSAYTTPATVASTAAIRPAHEDLESPEFVQCLVNNLGVKLEQVSENWEACRTIGLATVLATRVKSASNNLMSCVDDLLDLCRDLLHRQLAKAFTDYERIRHAESREDAGDRDSTQDDQNASGDNKLKAKRSKEMTTKRLEISLACLNTFSLDDGALREALQDPAKIQIFIECAMAVHESMSALEELDDFQKLLLWRWRQLIPNAAFILAGHELSQQQSGLTAAIQTSWPAFENVTPWAFKGSRWLATMAVVEENEEPREVRFDVLTAEIYFDGLPASSVPSEYLSRPHFDTLFRERDLSILPTKPRNDARLPLLLKCKPNGHDVHLGLSQGQFKHLLVLAKKNQVEYALVPSRLVRGILPQSVEASFVCWYNRASDRIEFRSDEDPWNCESVAWELLQIRNG